MKASTLQRLCSVWWPNLPRPDREIGCPSVGWALPTTDRDLAVLAGRFKDAARPTTSLVNRGGRCPPYNYCDCEIEVMAWSIGRPKRIVEIPRQSVPVSDVCTVCGKTASTLCTTAFTDPEATKVTPSGFVSLWFGAQPAKVADGSAFGRLELPYCDRHKKWGTMQRLAALIAGVSLFAFLICLGLVVKRIVAPEWIAVGGMLLFLGPAIAAIIYHGTRPFKDVKFLPTSIRFSGASKEFVTAANRESAQQISNAIGGLAEGDTNSTLPWTPR